MTIWRPGHDGLEGEGRRGPRNASDEGGRYLGIPLSAPFGDPDRRRECAMLRTRPAATHFSSSTETGTSPCTLSLPTGGVATGTLILGTPGVVPRVNPISLSALAVRESPSPLVPDPYPFDDSVVEFTTVDPSATLVDVTDMLVRRTVHNSFSNGVVTLVNEMCNFDPVIRFASLKERVGDSGGAVLLNRDPGTPPQNGATRTYPPTSPDYEDGVLARDECVRVTYLFSQPTIDTGTIMVNTKIFGVLLP